MLEAIRGTLYFGKKRVECLGSSTVYYMKLHAVVIAEIQFIIYCTFWRRVMRSVICNFFFLLFRHQKYLTVLFYRREIMFYFYQTDIFLFHINNEINIFTPFFLLDQLRWNFSNRFRC